MKHGGEIWYREMQHARKYSRMWILPVDLGNGFGVGLVGEFGGKSIIPRFGIESVLGDALEQPAAVGIPLDLAWESWAGNPDRSLTSGGGEGAQPWEGAGSKIHAGIRSHICCLAKVLGSFGFHPRLLHALLFQEHPASHLWVWTGRMGTEKSNLSLRRT